MNSLSKTADGGCLVSLRNLNQVVSLSPDFKTVRWRLGGPDSDFVFPDQTDRFTMQHTVSELPNGNILLFDNRAKLPEEEGGEKYSRALELRLDFDAKTAVKAWEFSPEPRMYSNIFSSAYRLDNGNTLVDFGSSPDFATVPIAIVEVDARGREAFRLESIDPRWRKFRTGVQNATASIRVQNPSWARRCCARRDARRRRDDRNARNEWTERLARLCQNQDLRDWRDFQDFVSPNARLSHN